VIVRALLQRTTRQGPPIQSPAAFADAIAGVAPPIPLPEPAPPAPPGYTERSYQDRGGYGGYPSNQNETDGWQSQGPQGTAPYPERRQSAQPPSGGRAYQQGAYPPAERRGSSRVLLIIVVVLVLAGIAATVWAVGLRKSPDQKASGGSTHSATHPSATPTSTTPILTPAGVTTFNIFGTDSENLSQAPNAIDGKANTYWNTNSYQHYPNFGNLKSGTGLLINMGKKVRLSKVEVSVGSIGATTAEIYLGDSGTPSKTALQNFKLVGHSATGTGTLTYTITSHATGQYVLIWLTGKLPADPDQPGSYQGRVYNVVIRGS
jgi:hypothetical protein